MEVIQVRIWKSRPVGVCPFCGSLDSRRLPKQSHALQNPKSTSSKREKLSSVRILFKHIEHPTNSIVLRQFSSFKILLIRQYNGNAIFSRFTRKGDYWLARNIHKESFIDLSHANSLFIVVQFPLFHKSLLITHVILYLLVLFGIN